eukprot:jgi/Mesvir1/25234/Mv20302-RA.1
MDNWPECHQVNFSGTIKIFLEAAKRNIPVIYTSSAAVYGDPVILPLNENDPINSKSPYGTDKYCSELQAKVFGYTYNLKSVTLRLFNVYGSRQDPNSPYSGVISIFAKQMSSNQPITVYGDGNQERDFIHVNDVIKLLIKSQEHVSTDANVYNGCTGNGTSLNKLIETLSNILNIKGEVNYHPFRNGDIYKSIGDPQKAQNDMGFVAQTVQNNDDKKLLIELKIAKENDIVVQCSVGVKTEEFPKLQEPKANNFWYPPICSGIHAIEQKA